ncbi:ABC transporter family substrate-binding protein [Brevibacterium moorei]|uniref:ABC transporter family substrate-binding protein n=1 Tax=Brevibacterium moorei TaxID=2968457 RepID=UPI00211B9FF0|nr:ABC transporter family substrate-binding protein [Brevibacterium sp. 68QC2CO]MCQ9385409.1 ABC transporter family substrate-binding protein [Brevibacterium sp. 68QC2CO]
MFKPTKTICALSATTALLLAGCTPNTADSPAQEAGGGNSEVSVMSDQVFYSMNAETNSGNAVTNSNVTYMMNDAFSYYDKDLKLQPNPSFGTVEKVSDKPMKVKYSIADTAKWSDGTPYSAADLVLAWGARSGNFNTKEAADATDEDGYVKKQKGKSVIFNSADPGLALIKDFPEVSADGKTATFAYSRPFADWNINMTIQDSGLPAHIVAKKALGIDDPTKANAAILKAFKDDDKAALAKIANVWNSGFDFTTLPDDPDLLIGTGPYKMTEFKKDQYVTLERRDDYQGSRKPKLDKITIRYNEDPTAAVQALQNGEVDVIDPQPTADIRKSLDALDGVTTQNGLDGTYEHLDTVFDNKGPFDPASYGGDKEKAKKVRQAFLMSVPRQKIVDDIIKPLNPDATTRDSFTQVPGSPAYDTIVAQNGLKDGFGTLDTDKAKSLLQEAGADKPKVRILYAKDNPRREQVFQLIKESAEKAGFEVVANADPQWSAHLNNTETYDAGLFGWATETTAKTETDSYFRTGGTNNAGKYSNPTVDKLLDDLQTQTDETKQTALLGDVEKHLVDDAYGTILYQFPAIVSSRNRVQGVDPITVMPTLFWNFQDWTVQD